MKRTSLLCFAFLFLLHNQQVKGGENHAPYILNDSIGTGQEATLNGLEDLVIIDST